MAAATEERTEQEPDPRDLEWPEGYREWLEELPKGVEHELSDLLDAMEGIKSLADTAILIYQNSSAAPNGAEPGKLDHRKARIIAPMREDAARSVWALYRRLDDFFALWRDYSTSADRGAFRLASEAENEGGSEAEDVDVERLFKALAVAKGSIGLIKDAELENSYGVSPRTVFAEIYEYILPTYDEAREALGLDEDECLTWENATVEALVAEREDDSDEGGESRE